MSQELADRKPQLEDYAGTDPDTSMRIMFFETLSKHKKIDLTKGDLPLFMDLLRGRRDVLFATSDRINEITKMGLQMPRGRDIINVSK
jgi:hypothetical protein